MEPQYAIASSRELRQQRKAAMLLELHAKITEMLVDISPKLTLDEVMIRQIVYIHDAKNIETDTNSFPSFIDLNKTSINRKLNKLVELDYIKRTKKGRKYIYNTSDSVLHTEHKNEEGTDIVDPIFDQIVDMIDTLIRE
ncbi:hypothetical protein [Roseibium sp.]|uniref:hypothetical protein n=1 Tax=Roseibium sp. TaxID=1936156 RepID=UPI003B52D816